MEPFSVDAVSLRRARGIEILIDTPPRRASSGLRDFKYNCGFRLSHFEACLLFIPCLGKWSTSVRL